MDDGNAKRAYYAHAFPVKQLFAFFTAHAPEHPDRREFAITFEVGDGDEAWSRYNTAVQPDHLRALVRRRNFHTLHVGPIFSDRASLRSGRTALDMVGQFLVFDLDLEAALFQYNPAKQGEVDRFCKMAFAKAGVLMCILNACFGFERFMPVYSGRRGVHLYVLDAKSPSGKEVWRYQNDVRRAICSSMDFRNVHDRRLVHSQSIANNPNFDDEGVQNAIEKAKEVLLTARKRGGVGLLDERTDVSRFLDLLFDDGEDEKFRAYRDRFRKDVESEVFLAFERGRSSATLTAIRNSCTKIHVNELERKRKRANANANAISASTSTATFNTKHTNDPFYTRRIDDIVAAMVWPDLDADVTSNIIHCVKAPFSLHGKTGRVAIPILPSQVFEASCLPPVVTGRDAVDGCNAFSSAVARFDSTVYGLLDIPDADLMEW
jgi:DNA primase small subunit